MLHTNLDYHLLKDLFQWPRILRLASAAARPLRLFESRLGHVCFLLSGRGLYDELFTRPEKSYRLWSVVLCVLPGNFVNEEAIARVGPQRYKKKSLLRDFVESC